MSIYKNGFTRQKVIDVIQAKNQGYASTNTMCLNECLYRSESDNNACLVGCFIPDNEYNETMEGKDANVIINRFNLEKYMPLDNILMGELQSFHDEELTSLHDSQDFFEEIEKFIIAME